MKFIAANEFDVIKYLSNKQNIFIYGAGEYGKYFFDFCKFYQIDITAFIDNNSNEKYENKKTFKPKEIFEKNPDALYVIASIGHRQVMFEDCVANGISEDNIFVFLPTDVLLIDYARIADIKKQIDVTNMRLLRRTSHPIIGFETHLVDHCNLNCKGCDQFAPIADEWFASVESYQKDMRRMSEIFGGEAVRIWLLGGEPLLHPRIIEFMEIARNNFASADILIFSNGLLLPKMNETFWNRCSELNIGLRITKYPVKFDYELIERKANSHNITFKYSNHVQTNKTLWKFTLDLNGKCDPRRSFLNCHQANICITLKEGGNLYTCPTAAHINLFNKYFGEKIGESKFDYINIYQESDPRKILKFLTEPIPTCRFCDVSNRKYGLEWGISRKEIDEWM